jgi:hypothetical protein
MDMDRIAKYVNEKFKHAGSSMVILNQKKEMIAGLQDKMRDLMAGGKSEDEAFKEVVASLGGMEELTEALNGRHRTVYINRLKFHHSLWVIATIMLEALVCFLFLPFRQDAAGILPYSTNPTLALSMFLGPMLLAIAVYPLVCGIVCAKRPQQAQLVAFNFRKFLTFALIGWLTISLFLFAVNMAFPPHYADEYMYLHDTPFVLGPFDIGIGVVFWFIYPVMVLLTWPISILIYNLLFKSKRYLAE